MSEAADELERMAEYVEKRTAGYEKAPPFSFAAGIAVGRQEAIRWMRLRATELRERRKPLRVDIGQWWSFDSASPKRTTSIYWDGHAAHAGFDGEDMPRDPMQAVDVMLADSRWLYLGDGPEPAQNA